jgi:cobalt-zinc-cadmium efflux system outer membrane protein
MRNVFLMIGLLLLAGCVFSPEGEDEERGRARDAWPGEEASALAPNASLEEILRHAYLSNAGLKERWWAWQAALEQIPQDSSQPTTLSLTYSQMFENGQSSWAQTTFGVANDPMASFVWPGKLSTAGRRALANARAAGHRFEAARLELRARVVAAWFEFALLAQTIRLRESDLAILETLVDAAGARVRAGTAPQQDVVKARTQRALARNRLETARSRAPGRRADLNALLNREPFAALEPPREFPAPRTFKETDQEILARLAERNPELEALAREAGGREEAVSLMRQQYIPDFALGAAADAGGLMRSIAGMVTIPIFRYPAIEASIAQARAELERTRAWRRQVEHDLKAKAVLLLYDLRNADRQSSLYRDAILPQAEQVVEATRAAYTAGRVPVIELLDSQRMKLEILLMLSELNAEREKALAELEALTAAP